MFGTIVSIFEHMVYHGLIIDARHCLHILLSLSVLAVVLGSVILSDHMNETDNHQYQEESRLALYGDDMNSRLFDSAVAFTLIIALPTIVDIVLNIFFLHTWEDLKQPIEFTRLFIVTVLFVPNFFIYWQVIPAVLVDLVMFCQYLCLFFALIYRIYTLSSPTQQMKILHAYPLRDLFIICLLTLASAFFFKLSTHNVISGRLAWKYLYTSLLLLLQVITCIKLKPWFSFTWHISKVLKNNFLLQNKTAFYAVMGGILISTAMTVGHAVTFENEYVYFSQKSESYIAIEWLFGGVLLVWTSVRNFEIRKTELATANQLSYNRKMTRSISHEIRTPLNTAFMALDLLISSLSQQQETNKLESRSIDTADYTNSADLVPNSTKANRRDTVLDTTNLLEIAESVKEGCDIALNILNQLLTFEKLSAGMLQLESKVLTVSELLESNMKLFKMQAQQCGITFKLDHSNVDINQGIVYVDEHKMNQVLRNLLSNAMKFTPRGGVVEVKLQWLHPDEREEILTQLTAQKARSRSLDSKDSKNNDDDSGKTPFSIVSFQNGKMRDSLKKVTNLIRAQSGLDVVPVTLQSHIPLHHSISGIKECGTILISVVDSGPGVSEVDQRKLFQEYVQINPGELQKGQGTGLGLSISKSIVHLHGGNIGMNSEGVGKGSTFYIELPSYHKSNDDILNGIYESVMDHSKIFSSKNSVKRSLSMSSMSRGGSFSQSHVSKAFDNSLSDSRNVGESPVRGTLEKVGSFFSKGSPVRRLDLSQELAEYQKKPIMQSEEISGRSNAQTTQVMSDRPDYCNDVEQGLNTRSKMKEGVESSDAQAMTDYFRNIFSSAGIGRESHYRNKVVPCVAPSQSAITRTGDLYSDIVNTLPSNADTDISHPPFSDTVVVIGESRVEISNNKIAPFAVTQPPISGSNKQSMKSNNKRRMSFNGVVAKSYRILVVDDSVPNRKMLARLLSRENHLVTEASDGCEAVDIIRESVHGGNSAFDLILMDYYMPVMTGPEAIEVIRKLGFTNTILGVSGVMDDDVNRFIEAGASLVLCKPISLAGMWKALRGTNFFDNDSRQDQ